MGRAESLLDRSLPVAWGQEGRASPLHLEGKGWARPRVPGALVASPRSPGMVLAPSWLAASRMGWSSPSPRSPWQSCHVSTPKCPNCPLLAPTTAGPCPILRGAHPGTGLSPCVLSRGQLLAHSPQRQDFRTKTSLNPPRLRALWAAVSLMPGGAPVCRCSSLWHIGNVNQAGETFPNIAARFWGISDGLQHTSTSDGAGTQRVHL